MNSKITVDSGFKRFSYNKELHQALKTFTVDKTENNIEYKSKKNAKKQKEEHNTIIRKIIITAVITLICFSLVLFLQAKNNELNCELKKQESKLKILQSETISLNTKLENKLSFFNIDEYALNKLNMRKATSADYVYINVEEFKNQRKGDN